LRSLLAAALALGAIAGPSSAWAGGDHDHSSATEPRLARWRQDTVVLHVDASIDLIGPGAFEAVIASVSAWQLADPSLPTLVVERACPAEVKAAEHRPGFNLLRFEPQGAPLAKGALAITIASSDPRTGQMVDADIVFNGQHHFAVLGATPDRADATPVPYDFQNVLTHELGHYLGISHETLDDAEATMFLTSSRGETQKRDLADSDRSLISNLYLGADEPEPAPDVPGLCGATLAKRAPRSQTDFLWPLLVSALLGLRLRKRRA
jgi:hypothetical protein